MKSYLVYVIVFLMFLTSALYFLVAILGESLESGDSHGLQVAQGQEEPAHNETEEEEHDEATKSTEQHNEEQDALEESVEEQGNTEGEGVEQEHDETAENQRKTLELPLFVGAGVGYAAVGIWMIIDKRNSKIPYLVAMAGSLVLLVLYFSSRTVGFLYIGTEPFSVFDFAVALIQIAIIVISSYIVYRKQIKGITVDK